MDLTIIAELLNSINPIVLGSVAGAFLVAGGAGLYIKRNKNKFIDNTDPFAQPNDFKTLKTEDLEREFGSLTVQTKMLDEDESLFFDKSPKDKLTERELTQPSTKLVDEASVFDSFGKQEQALESLKKAVDIEKHEKERVRLKILLSQYNIKKGKVSLDDIIQEYPSFHAKVSFGPDNTLSALMGSAIPKTDADLQNSVNKEIDKEFDIFADLPILNEQAKVVQENVSSVSPQKNLFDDLPNIEQVSQSDNQDIASMLKKADSNLFQLEPNVQESSQLSLFDDLPPIHSSDNVKSVQQEEKMPLPNNFDNSVTTQVDQFAWNSHTSTDSTNNDTESMLKELQNDAEKIDKINETEAMDDMQKFWQEFGTMVVDIKKEVSENNNKSFSTEELMPVPVYAESTVNTEKVTSTVASDFSNISEPSHVTEEKNLDSNTNNTLNNKEQQLSQDIEPPVLSVVITTTQSSSKLDNNADLITSATSTPVPAQVNAIKETPINPVSTVNSESHVLPSEVVTQIKPETFKVWANWIVNIEGQQVLRNHFINLRNPWGSIKAGEELYGGINRLSGKDINGKNYPWVLVSVFPLSKE